MVVIGAAFGLAASIPTSVLLFALMGRVQPTDQTYYEPFAMPPYAYGYSHLRPLVILGTAGLFGRLKPPGPIMRVREFEVLPGGQ